MDATHDTSPGTSNCTHCAMLGRDTQFNPRTLRQGLCKKGYDEAKAAGTLPVKRLPKGETRQCEAMTGEDERCPENAKAHGLCPTHVARYYRHAEVNAPIHGGAQAPECTFDDCDKPVHADGLCAGHDTQRKRGKPLTPLRRYKKRGGTCEAIWEDEQCPREVANDGHCVTHYERKRSGEPDWNRPIRKKGPHGEGYITDDGYRMIYVDGVRRREHIHEMEKLLGNRLRPGENVHHRNGDRLDNRTDGPLRLTPHGKLFSGNLELWSTKQPAGQEIGPKLDYAFEMVEEYLTYLDPARARHLLALAAMVTPEQISVERERALAALDAEVAAEALVLAAAGC